MTFALPSDLPSAVALVVGVVALAHPRTARALGLGSPRLFQVGASLAAALLSLGYVAYYLRGGPRIVDATTYLLEARGLGEGHFAWPVTDPAASTAGRFLVRDTLGDGAHLAAIFPPGWPAVLAIGVRAGAPMLVGPVLAFCLTWLTIDLAARVADAALAAEHRALVPRVAGLLSV
ncbi:MAG TPA: hypothetical protein VL400_24515, partial [Polyangiaceae bacterium]|nr:hypothetical protein [Polyangiaceae bacterium]